MKPFRLRAFTGALRLLLLASVGMLWGLAPSGCGESTPRCTPGQSVACAGSGCMGYQVCSSGGASFGECICGNGNNDLFPTTGPNSGLIGAACTGAESCRVGFDCLAADSKLIGGKGPSAGICLARCVPEHDFCKDLDARSKCRVLNDGGTPANKLDDAAYCLPGCQMGTLANELDKCRGRSDSVCSESPAGSGAGYCLPACRSDVDCAGRFCDLGTGLCQDAAPAGTPIGSACTPGATTATCAGACIAHSLSYAECSGVCSYDTPGCGQADTTFPLKYFCKLAPAAGSGLGDLGYCAKLCDCDMDCGRPDAVCEPDEALTPKTGRVGSCGSKLLPSGAARKNTPC